MYVHVCAGAYEHPFMHSCAMYVHKYTCTPKLQVGYKSPNMEVEAMRRSLKYLENKVTISENVTDASISVISMLCMLGTY